MVTPLSEHCLSVIKGAELGDTAMFISGSCELIRQLGGDWQAIVENKSGRLTGADVALYITALYIRRAEQREAELRLRLEQHIAMLDRLDRATRVVKPGL